MTLSSTTRSRRETADLSRFRYHTGAALRRLEPGEPCPVLFRDLGPEATARFLRGTLRRLAGPLSPITYMRTADYIEPYDDPEAIGRLAILRPSDLDVWHSGVPTIYVAEAGRSPGPDALGYIPGSIPLAEAAQRLQGATTTAELREALGGRHHDGDRREALARLDRLGGELAEAERLAEPLRRDFQASDPRRRESARAAMERLGIGESDLCAAWHHLPRDRRVHLVEALRSLAGEARR